MHKYSIVIEKDEDGYWGYCPELQGCYSQGDTYEETKTNMRDAIKLYMEDIYNERKDYSSCAPL